ncbi:NAD(P)H-dependent oxidoreductase [Oxalobacteraceae bacterium]|nr:NAD(P)H-dependent oxidoreductase [Oxalobacteraceae bacterium]
MKILAISGSLRAASINSMLLRVLVSVAPPGVEVAIYTGLGQLPLFNPDIDMPPPVVAALQDSLTTADAVVIASPEYAHGVTGAIKNGLDWMVGNDSFIDKPVAIFNASPRATHADAALREIMTVMSAKLVEAACVSLPLVGARLTEQEMRADPHISRILFSVLLSLRDEIAAAGTLPRD